MGLTVIGSNANVLSNPLKTVAHNSAISCVFFEDNNLCYNYKTKQWTRIPAFGSTQFYDAHGADSVIGRIVWSGDSVDFQVSTSGEAQTATLVTGESTIGARSIIQGVRPLHNGGTAAVRVGTRDSQQDSVTWSTSTSVNSRTRMANFRNEGRYHRIELTLTGGFTTAMGADVEYYAGGKV